MEERQGRSHTLCRRDPTVTRGLFALPLLAGGGPLQTLARDPVPPAVPGPLLGCRTRPVEGRQRTSESKIGPIQLKSSR